VKTVSRDTLQAWPFRSGTVMRLATRVPTCLQSLSGEVHGKNGVMGTLTLPLPKACRSARKRALSVIILASKQDA
jgi:hypothetical protein